MLRALNEAENSPRIFAVRSRVTLMIRSTDAVLALEAEVESHRLRGSEDVHMRAITKPMRFLTLALGVLVSGCVIRLSSPHKTNSPMQPASEGGGPASGGTAAEPAPDAGSAG